MRNIKGNARNCYEIPNFLKTGFLDLFFSRNRGMLKLTNRRPRKIAGAEHMAGAFSGASKKENGGRPLCVWKT